MCLLEIAISEIDASLIQMSLKSKLKSCTCITKKKRKQNEMMIRAYTILCLNCVCYRCHKTCILMDLVAGKRVINAIKRYA